MDYLEYTALQRDLTQRKLELILRIPVINVTPLKEELNRVDKAHGVSTNL